MKKWWNVLAATLGIAVLYTIPASAAVYYPNSDTPAYERTTESSLGQDALVTWRQNDAGQWLCVDQTGASLTGWQYVDSNWFYLSPGMAGDVPLGVMVTGWQSIYSDSYQKNFDYYFDSSGRLAYSPSESFVTYGHKLDYDETVTRAEAQASYLQNAGINGKVIRNQMAFDVLKGYDTVENATTYLNSGLFINNGYGAPGLNIFSNNTALTADRSGRTEEERSDVSVNGHSMNNCKIALYFGGETAVAQTGSDTEKNIGNLLAASQAEGALGAFGFLKPVSVDSEDRFTAQLVQGLAEGQTLKAAALRATTVIPVYDNSRLYNFVGGGTRLYMTGENRTEVTYDVPDDETYEYYCRIGGYETYIQTVDGFMTSDYYMADLNGTVFDLRDEISESDVREAGQTGVRKLEDLRNGILDVYEKIGDEVKPIRVTKKALSHSPYRTLNMTIVDLETGQEIPYGRILKGY